MSVLDVVKWYNPVLEQVAEPIVFGSDRLNFGSCHLKVLAFDMIETTNRFNGVGISGNQVNVPLRIFVMKRERVENPDLEMNLTVINPILTVSGPEATMNEGCLSVPGVYNQVSRPSLVKMNYQDVEGAAHEIFLGGIEARIAQHEVDHLDGKMFFDRMSRQMRKATIREWEKKEWALRKR